MNLDTITLKCQSLQTGNLVHSFKVVTNEEIDKELIQNKHN